MKKLILIIACLIAIGANAQSTWTAKYEDVKDDAYYRNKYKARQDSLEEATKDIITDEDRVNAKGYDPRVGGSAYTREGKAYYKINMLEERERRWKADSIRNIEIEKRNEESKKVDAQRLKELTKQYGAVIAKRIMKEQVWIGMTDAMCEESLTTPNDKKTTYTKAGKTEVWIYQGQADGCIGDDCPYLDYIITFKNHKAVAITTD